MHCPLGEYVAVYSCVLTQPVAAYDLKTAAADAAAKGHRLGWRLMAVMTKEQYEQEQQEKR